MIKKLGILVFIIALAGLAIGFYLYQSIFSPNVTQKYELYITKDMSFDDVKYNLASEGIIENASAFDLVSKLMKYDESNFKKGHFTLEEGLNTKQLVGLLRSGKQTPQNLTFNNVRTIEELMGNISSQLEIDSLALLAYVTDEANLTAWNKTKENILSAFIPNTYQVYWNTSKESLIERLFSESEKWWEANDREAKAKALSMSKEEVYALASIVEKETLVNSEKPRVAGVYLNRLRRGILLQADPTVVFANGDFSIRRVLNKHLALDSPYNTYMYPGLPPGPIYMPQVSSLEAVLNPEKHSFLYFCAKTDNSGQHQFAKTLIEHNRNAKNYQRWLTSQRIMK